MNEDTARRPALIREAAVRAALIVINVPMSRAPRRQDGTDHRARRLHYLASIEMHRQGEAYHVPGEFVAVVGQA